AESAQVGPAAGDGEQRVEARLAAVGVADEAGLVKGAGGGVTEAEADGEGVVGGRARDDEVLAGEVELVEKAVGELGRVALEDLAEAAAGAFVDEDGVLHADGGAAGEALPEELDAEDAQRVESGIDHEGGSADLAVDEAGLDGGGSAGDEAVVPEFDLLCRDGVAEERDGREGGQGATGGRVSPDHLILLREIRAEYEPGFLTGCSAPWKMPIKKRPRPKTRA